MIDQATKDMISPMSPVANPIKAIGLTKDEDMPQGTGKQMETTGMGTTGLDTHESVMMMRNVDDVVTFLSGLDYGTYIEEYYDCEDRAFWAMAHARHRYPGFPIGVASGKATTGRFAGKEHAVVVLWYEGGGLKTKYWDPDGKTEIDPLSDVMSITSYPIGYKEDTTPPVNEYKRLNDEVLLFDPTRLIYPLKGDKGLLNYLKKMPYDDVCAADHKIYAQKVFDRFWKSYDAALWAFIHVRRAYVGCPVGVAIGKPHTAVVIWYNENDQEDGDLKHMFWDPLNPRKDDFPGFTPSMIFV